MTEHDFQHEIDLRDEAIRRIDAELARQSAQNENLWFICRCPICNQTVTVWNDRTHWRILVHRVDGERCAGSGKAWRMRTRGRK